MHPYAPQPLRRRASSDRRAVEAAPIVRRPFLARIGSRAWLAHGLGPLRAHGLGIWAVVALLLSFAPFASAAPLGEAQEPPRAADEASARDAPRRGPQAGAGLRIWWNQPRYVRGLDLSPELRLELDAELERHRAARAEQMAEVRNARLAVAEALGAGDWPRARSRRAELGQALAEQSTIETGLVQAVLEKLSAQQRKTIVERFPGVLRRPWLMGGAAGRPGAPAALRSAAGSDP